MSMRTGRGTAAHSATVIHRYAISDTATATGPGDDLPGHCRKGLSGRHQAVFKAAMQQGKDGEPPLLTSSPCDGFRLLPGPVTARTILYGPEVSIYLHAVHDIDPDTALFIVTEMATGLRWGEIAGLHVSGLDPVACVIHALRMDESNSIPAGLECLHGYHSCTRGLRGDCLYSESPGGARRAVTSGLRSATARL
ncbi:hypothetical protein [Nonomuraea sp. NPDC049695]|uniref:hypothetical protein n=1 Tax=Nonomuraea sp. NPDC049695 TaxID=3154734 RepID=UPI00343EA4AC